MVMKSVCLLVFVFCLAEFSSARVTNHVEKRDADSKMPEICERNTPCRWEVYKKNLSKDVEYVMNNVCVCPTGKKCLRHSDDISISAYIHKCLDSS